MRSHTLLAEERPRNHDIFSILFGTFKYTLYLCTQIQVNMTEVHKKYRLTSMEEPTDEMLQALMEDVAMAARESTARAKAEKQRRFSEVVRIIKARRSLRAHRRPAHLRHLPLRPHVPPLNMACSAWSAEGGVTEVKKSSRR